MDTLVQLAQEMWGEIANVAFDTFIIPEYDSFDVLKEMRTPAYVRASSVCSLIFLVVELGMEQYHLQHSPWTLVINTLSLQCIVVAYTFDLTL